MKILQKLSDNNREDSLANRFRRKRFAFFLSLLQSLPAYKAQRPISILDVGGTQLFWEQMGSPLPAFVSVSLLNPSSGELEANKAGKQEGFRRIQGDARDMHEVKDQEFDVAFSNSVIEHVGSFEDQRRMMKEMQRVAPRYFMQTPNYYFPMEPHFHVLGFQYLPFSVRVFLVQQFQLGWFEKAKSRAEAEALVRSCALLCRKDLQCLDPQASIFEEKFFGLTKSFVLYHGWGRAVDVPDVDIAMRQVEQAGGV